MSYGMSAIPLLDANGAPVLQSFPFGASYCNEFDGECVDWMLRYQGQQMKARGATTPVYGDPDYDAYVQATMDASSINIPWTAAVPPPNYVSTVSAPVMEHASPVMAHASPVMNASPAPELVNTPTGQEVVTPGAATDFLKGHVQIGDYSVPWWILAAGAGALLFMGGRR